jgi:hypothetical protein
MLYLRLRARLWLPGSTSGPPARDPAGWVEKGAALPRAADGRRVRGLTRAPAERWEFIDGPPRLIAPASIKHTIIKDNVGLAVRQGAAELGWTGLADGPQILTGEISAIPDVVVACSALDLATPVIAERVAPWRRATACVVGPDRLEMGPAKAARDR